MCADGVSVILQRVVTTSMGNSVNATMSTVKNMPINSVQVICIEKLIFNMCFVVYFFKISS